jgi:hypothetical protein
MKLISNEPHYVIAKELARTEIQETLELPLQLKTVIN